jgi:DNA-binding NarL/FixJ family response regulator
LARSQIALRDAEPEIARFLTVREAEIAGLIAEGATNARIAERLNVGVKTVEKHVSSILAKLGARSRTRIASYVAETRE